MKRSGRLIIILLLGCLFGGGILFQDKISAAPKETESIQSTDKLESTSSSEKNLLDKTSTTSKEETTASTTDASTEVKSKETGAESQKSAPKAKDELIEELTAGWTNIPLNSTEGVLKNPWDSSSIGFNKRGISGWGSSPEEGVYFKDKTGFSLVENGASPSYIPYIDNKMLYNSTATGGQALASRGIGFRSRPEIKEKYFLRKGDKLRQILQDPQNALTYVLDLAINPNLSFSIRMSMYNRANTERTFSMLEMADARDETSSGTPYVNAISGGNGVTGFYFDHYSGSTSSTLVPDHVIKVRKKNLDWLSDYRRIGPGTMDVLSVAHIDSPAFLRTKNYFTDNFSKEGVENDKYGGSLSGPDEQTGYQLGAPPKKIMPGKALVVGYDLSTGEEPPYMEMSATPEEYNVYENYSEDKEGNFHLTKIPYAGDNGTITFTYPDGTTSSQPYNSDNNKEAKGQFTIPRKTLPEVLNPVAGTIKTYKTDVLAVNKNHLTSEEYKVPINVYHIGAQPKAQMIQKGTVFKKEAKELIQNPIILPGHTASYKYEGDLPDTSKEGLTYVKVKMTDQDQPDHTATIKVPVQVTEMPPPTKGLYIAANDFTFDASEALGSTQEEINQQILKKSEAAAWDVGSGAIVEVSVESTTVTMYPKIGTHTAVLTARKGSETKTKEIKLMAEDKFVENLIAGWEVLPLGSDKGVITSTLGTGSQVGFHNRGLDGFDVDQHKHQEEALVYRRNGFTITQGDDGGILIPYINNEFVYPPTNMSPPSAQLRSKGIGTESRKELTDKIFFKKDNILKQILIDRQNKLTYVRSVSLTIRQDYQVEINVYNRDKEERTLSLLEDWNLDKLYGGTTLYSLGNNRGIYVELSGGLKSVTFKLKDAAGNWLSNYRRYSYLDTGSSLNQFGNDFSKPGIEIKNYPEGQILQHRARFQMGAPPKNIKPDKALTVGYTIDFNKEIPYMQVETTPKEYNIYENHAKDVKGDYQLSQIPAQGNTGKIIFTYPDKTTSEQSYVADVNKMSKGSFTIPRKTLPQELNPTAGTIKSYYTDILAINQNDLPSQEYATPINVYHLGAKARPQIISKGTPFTKQAKDIVKNPVILPGHEALYEYEGEMPDTSTVGLKHAIVRMTDKNQPEQTERIKVPVQVVDGTVPSTGLVIGANNFKTQTKQLTGLTQEELNKEILKRSEAVAWDIGTGSSDGVQLEVDSTTVAPNPKPGDYTAVLKASKGTMTKKTTITITLIDEQKLQIKFVDEAGDPLHEAIVLTREIGSSVDLTKEQAVQSAVESILNKKYQLYKKPEHETNVLIESEEKIVQYEFKGTLTVQSAPKFLNFGRESLGTPFIKVEQAKYDQPLVIWDNRKVNSPWVLSATLKKPLTSQVDETQTLPQALRYKVNEDESVVLSKDVSQPIALRKHEGSNEYDISKEWDKQETGLQLEVPSGEVRQSGGYRAKILWQLSETP